MKHCGTISAAARVVPVTLAVKHRRVSPRSTMKHRLGECLSDWSLTLPLRREKISTLKRWSIF